ncbi:MAG: hypothetical protein BWY17_02795 [Deltaproteobacteria bacterium ADurb.Bin207]|nr:MAG: hypothetical protein BWY17_02795 [Deltaproteobacteria bacterium ADurb.Bin207]
MEVLSNVLVPIWSDGTSCSESLARVCYDSLMSLRVFLATVLIGFALSFGTFGIRQAQAHTFIDMPLSYLAKTAHRVIVGVPVENMSVWESTEGGRRIVTYHRVQISAHIVGDGEREVWVRTLGGVVEGIGQLVHGAASLRPQQPVLLFLVERVDKTYSVVGMEQGSFPVRIDKTRMTVESRRMAHAPLAGKPGVKPASVLEGLSLGEARRLIMEARSGHGG